MKSTTRVKNGSLTSLYGAFESKESADEIILNLRQARTFQQTREQL
ncbi:MAG: hypothetical protein KGZ58_13390 [Ignavibacteriales bacterium]|nr:hypothetical protein [Ignavibacteriales bacterium]